MTSREWEKRIAKIVRNYDVTKDVGVLRNEYRSAAMSGAPNAGLAQVLLEARDHLEAWQNPNDASPAAFEQWRLLHQRIPKLISEAFLKRLPKAAVEPNVVVDFVVNCADVEIVDSILNLRLLTEKQLNEAVRAEPKRLYESAVVDSLIARRALRELEPIWLQANADVPRPTGLMSPEAVITYCYRTLHKEKADSLLAQSILSRDERGRKLLRALLDERAAAKRFVDAILRQQRQTLRVDAKRGQLFRILLAWVQVCAEATNSGSPEAALTASMILVLIRLACMDMEAMGNEWSQLSEQASEIEQSLAKQVLREHEGAALTGRSPAILLRGSEMYHVVQGYLSQLHSGAADAEAPVGRSEKYEQYVGAKRVLDHILSAMGKTTDPVGLPAALEVALFNSDVRPLGAEGEAVEFDPRRHETTVPGILPGDRVVVRRPGRKLGDSDGVVLVKAVVDEV